MADKQITAAQAQGLKRKFVELESNVYAEAFKLADMAKLIDYAPGLQDSGDLEAATTVITATSKQGTPDYQTTLTLPMPADSELEVKNCALRLDVTIDSFGAETTSLTYRVFVNDDVTETIGGEWNSIGSKKQSKNKSIDIPADGIWNCKVFFWVNGGDGATISLVQLRLSVGAAANTDVTAVKLTADGMVSSHLESNVLDGTQHMYEKPNNLTRRGVDAGGGQELRFSDAIALAGFIAIQMRVDNNETDMNYLTKVHFNILQV